MLNWTAKDARMSRPATCKLLEMAEAGGLSWEQLAREALGWISEGDVRAFADSNDYIQDDSEDTDEEDNND